MSQRARYMAGWAVAVLVAGFTVSVCPADTKRAREIFDATGVKGGLVVHLHCGDGQLTAALRASDSYLVHGLDADAANVAGAREHIRKLGLCGKVSVARLAGERLPYADNLVRLVVAEKLGSVAAAEVTRVLAPGGVAYVKGEKTVKPRPTDIDQWTHYLHDASNNAVAHDAQVGPPRHLQWQTGPRWSRHHDHMASVSAMVSTGGRMFCIVDEGSPVSPQLPSDWKLIARDAFSGVLLWKRAIEQWHPSLWPLKSGPANLPRRLVAEGEVVYATLGLAAPVVELDAATGRTLREHKNTAGAEEIVRKGRVLLVLVNRTPFDLDVDLKDDPEKGRSRDGRTTASPAMGPIWAGVRSRRWTHGDRCIRAFDTETGRPLWQRPSRVIPLTLAADADNAYYHDGGKIVAVDLSTGKQRWTSPPVAVWQGLDGRGLQSWFAPTLVACEGKVVFAGGEKIHMSYVGWGSKDIGQDTMTAFAAKDGRKLWTASHPYSGYNSPEDLFVTGGKVWTGTTAKGGGGGRYTGHDINTGKVISDFPPTVKAYWFHHRCYRAKATDRFILSSRAGIELIDLKTGQWTINHWVRGGCLYGLMPANGMIYVPPNPCACYPEAKIYGFAALAPPSASRALPKTVPPAGRLERGGGEISKLKAQISKDDWPTYRHDPARSGATASAAGAELRTAWDVRLGGKLTPPVVGGGRLFVADVDAHVVHALDAASGKAGWHYIAGGRVDSAPTYHNGRLLFGSADGYVYCLRARDGELAWRFRAAPIDRRLVAFDQVESTWPVHGSVLVRDGVATVVAGRSMFLDGGLRLCRLNVETGQLLGEKVLDERDPQTGENLQTRVRGLNMPVALPDILASDGEYLYMRSQAMDFEGNRPKLGPGSTGRKHLLAPYGFTDDSWFHRVYWLFGNSFSGGIGGYGNGRTNPAGRILVHNDKTIFGYGRRPQFYRWSSVMEYQLFATARSGGGPSASPSGPSGAPAAVYFKNTSSLDPTGKPLTIAAWVKTDSPDGTILVRGAQAIGFGLILTGGKPRMLVRAKGKTHSVLADKPIGRDWTHVAGVLRPNGRMEIYVAGQPAGAVENVPSLTGNPQIPMKVGYDDTNQLLPEPLVPFSGALDDVMLFHRALTPEQIARLAGAPASAKDVGDSLVLHLDFTNGKARDRSAAGNHGRLESAKTATVEGPRGQVLLLSQPKRPVRPAKRRRGKGRSRGIGYLWTRSAPMMVRAMVLAADTLFIAGPPDMLDEEAAFQKDFSDKATRKRLAAQDAALKGRSGAMLHAVSAESGKTLAEYRLDIPPVFDGLIAAGGRLYLSTTDGRIICMAPK